MTKQKPRFKHGCQKCVFLGHLDINSKRGDVWVCQGHEKHDTVIVRHSDERSDYLATSPAYFGPLSPPFTCWRNCDVVLLERD